MYRVKQASTTHCFHLHEVTVGGLGDSPECIMPWRTKVPLKADIPWALRGRDRPPPRDHMTTPAQEPSGVPR